MLVDSHCHLDHFDGDGEEEVARAAEAGVDLIVTICTTPAGAEHGRRISERHPSVVFAAGLHPNCVSDTPLPAVAELAALAEHPKMVGIGESGLDYFRSAESAERQQASLRAHIEAARQCDLPLIIHARSADEDVGRILAEEYDRAPYRCVMHCFSSSAELARRALDMGFYLSMAGNATFRKAEELRAIFAEAPADRILVETDAPYLAPEPRRGTRNEPALVVHTARMGASLRGMEEEAFARQTTENFHRLFTKAPRPASANA